MANLTCPNCDAEMQKNEDADMTTDECASCGGVFLQRGELNALATGMSGDIEYCSVTSGFVESTLPARACPGCGHEPMEKINLLRLSDLIFDYCPECGGFFLNKDEIEQMNEELRRLAPDQKAQEYRGHHDGHLVRIDRTSDIYATDYLGWGRAKTRGFIRVSAFFREPMPPGIRVFHERWPIRLTKGLGLFWGQDILTGDKRFDSEFRVQGENPESVARYLDPAARAALLSFVRIGPSILGKQGSLEVTSSAVVYVEGPYDPNSPEDVVGRAGRIIELLVNIANKVEAIPE